MLLATTKNGTQYKIDLINQTVQRSGRPIKVVGDIVEASAFAQELQYTNEPTVEVGKTLYFLYANGLWSQSTEIVSIQELDQTNDLA